MRCSFIINEKLGLKMYLLSRSAPHLKTASAEEPALTLPAPEPSLKRSLPNTQQLLGRPLNNIIEIPDSRQLAYPRELRPIVIDGSNVAIQHSIAIGRGSHRFSSEGLKTCVDFFKQRGHEVTAFVPQYRTKSGRADDCNLQMTDGPTLP